MKELASAELEKIDPNRAVTQLSFTNHDSQSQAPSTSVGYIAFILSTVPMTPLNKVDALWRLGPAGPLQWRRKTRHPMHLGSIKRLGRLHRIPPQRTTPGKSAQKKLTIVFAHNTVGLRIWSAAAAS